MYFVVSNSHSFRILLQDMTLSSAMWQAAARVSYACI